MISFLRVASFNVEDLFARPRAFNASASAVGDRVVADYQEFNALIGRPVCTPADRQRMRELLVSLDVPRQRARRDPPPHHQQPRRAWLRKNRGIFDRQPADPTLDVQVEATGRADWIGWLELATEAVDETGTPMTARVIADLRRQRPARKHCGASSGACPTSSTASW